MVSYAPQVYESTANDLPAIDVASRVAVVSVAATGIAVNSSSLACAAAVAAAYWYRSLV